MPPRASKATERICSDCKEKKPVSEFHGKGTAWDGTLKYQSYCRKCANKRRSARGHDPVMMCVYQHRSYMKHRQAALDYAAQRRLKPGVKERDADKHLLRKYGLTRDDWWKLLEEQNFECYGCWGFLDPQVHFSSGRSKTGKICVDHDHACCPGTVSCGRCVRGLLCDDCNRGAGSCKDDPDTLERLAAHIRRFRNGNIAFEHPA